MTRAVKLQCARYCWAQGLDGCRPSGKFPVEILWATLRNARLIFGLQSKWGKARLAPSCSTISLLKCQQSDLRVIARMQAKPAGADDVLVTSRVASAAEALIRRLESPSAVTELLQALLAGDLIQPVDDSGTASALAPFYVPGKPDSFKLRT